MSGRVQEHLKFLERDRPHRWKVDVPQHPEVLVVRNDIVGIGSHRTIDKLVVVRIVPDQKPAVERLLNSVYRQLAPLVKGRRS